MEEMLAAREWSMEAAVATPEESTEVLESKDQPVAARPPWDWEMTGSRRTLRRWLRA
jgi:hypothetical protein